MLWYEKQWSEAELNRVCKSIENRKVFWLYRCRNRYLLVLRKAMLDYVNEMWVRQGLWKMENPTTDHDLVIHELPLAIQTVDKITAILNARKQR